MALKKFSFNVKEIDNKARLGLIKTHRGNINTPTFMPVGTQATIKSAFIDDVVSTCSQIILANTYHLLLMSTKVLLDDKLKKKELIGRFEQSCISESIKRGMLTRQDKINKYLVETSLNFDSSIDFFESPIDVIGKGRIAILDYLNNLNTKCITKEMVLFLDGCRMVLKDSSKENHLRIMEILNQVIERKLYVEKNW